MPLKELFLQQVNQPLNNTLHETTRTYLFKPDEDIGIRSY